MRRRLMPLALAAGISLVTAGVAHAQFTPQFSMEMSDTKVLGNPQIDLHLEFDADDEEIGNFILTIPKGFNVASDEQVPDKPPTIPGIPPNSFVPGASDGEVIGGGTITIEAGPACRPGPEGQIPVSGPVPLDATIYERARTDEEADAGVHAVWFLDLEPANRVRLIVRGTPATGWTVEGAPTPSDNTCNPLTVDLTINSKSESGVPLITNPAKPGKATFTATINSQDSPAVANFTTVVKITK